MISLLDNTGLTISTIPNTPRIRFKGFTKPWERKTLKDMIVYPMDYGLNAAATKYDGKHKYLRITDIDEETRVFNKIDITSPNVLEYEPNYKLMEGDIVFARTGASVGKTYIYKETDGQVYFAGFLIRARINIEENSPYFVFTNTQTENYKKFIQITSQRTGQPGVNAQEYESYSLYVPSVKEQQKIGDFFREQDEQINTAVQQIHKLKIIKQALLQKMFAA